MANEATGQKPAASGGRIFWGVVLIGATIGLYALGGAWARWVTPAGVWGIWLVADGCRRVSRARSSDQTRRPQ